MIRILATTLKGILCLVGMASCLLVSRPAQAQVEIEVSPPAVYLATAVPVYFEGRATYWYRDRWYYRDGPHWRHHVHEPVYLREHRRRYWQDERHGPRWHYGPGRPHGYRHGYPHDHRYGH